MTIVSYITNLNLSPRCYHNSENVKSFQNVHSKRDVYLIRDIYLIDVYLVYNIPMRIVDNLALLIVYTYMYYSIPIEP